MFLPIATLYFTFGHVFKAKRNGVFSDDGFASGCMRSDKDTLMTLQMQNGLFLEDVQFEGPFVRHLRNALVEIVDGLIDHIDVDGPLPVTRFTVFSGA